MEWMYSSTHSLTSVLDGGDWSASRPGHFTPSETTYLDTMSKRKIPSPCRDSIPEHPIIQPVVSRYTDWAIPALKYDANLCTCVYAHIFPDFKMSRDSSVGIATGYGLDERKIGVRFIAGAGNFSPRHHVKTGSGAHPAFYPMGTGGYFPEGKVGGELSGPFTAIRCWGQRMRGAIPPLSNTS
jgi:hypothetical protein